MALLPKVKLKALVSFPASILDGVGTDVIKKNGNYQIDLAYDDFAPPVAGIPNPATATILTWDTVTKAYSLTPVSVLGAGGGVPEAPLDHVLYGRKDAAWIAVPSTTVNPSNANPIMDGVAAPGVAVTYSRGDHVHPTDTSLQPADADLTAIAALSSTGIARRTATTPAWSVGGLVTNAELTAAPANTLKGNPTGASATPSDFDIAALTTKGSPGGGDYLLLSDQAASGLLKKIAISTLPGASGGIPEAPNDGQLYGRKSLGWTAVSGGGGLPGGADKQVQFNDAGVFGGDANFTWDKAAKTVGIAGALSLVPITGNAQLFFNPVTAGVQAFNYFYDAGVLKWTLGKHSDNEFTLYDNVNGRFTILAANSGDLTLNPATKVLVTSPVKIATGDGNNLLQVGGATHALRVNCDTVAAYIDGVDGTGTASFQQLVLRGTQIVLQASGSSNQISVSSAETEVIGAFDVTDVSTRARITNSGGNVYLEAGNSAFSAVAPLIITGANSVKLNQLTLDAANVAVNGGLGATGNIAAGWTDITATTIELGQRRTSDGFAFIDFHSSVGKDYDARILRAPGVNATFAISNDGGAITIDAHNAATQLVLDNLTLNIGVSAGAYLNWNAPVGGTFGAAGYGIRDNGGTIEIKNSGGSWTGLGTYGAYWTGAPNYILTTDAVWNAAIPQTLTDAATVTPNFGTGFDFLWTLGAAGRTLANPTGPKYGQKGIIYLMQDGTGSRTITTWGSQYKFPGGTKPTLSTAAGSVDVISYCVKSLTEIECFFSAAMS